MDLNKYLVEASSIGDWGGYEDLAANNLNRIYKALDLRITPILIVGKEHQWDPELYDLVMRQVRDAWMDKDRLLNVTDDEIADYVESVAEIYHIPPPPPRLLDNVELNEPPRSLDEVKEDYGHKL